MLICLISGSLAVSYNNEWAAECKGGLEEAEGVSKDTGCELHGEVIPGSDIFQFKCHHVRKRSTVQDDEAHKALEDHDSISWAEQQQVKTRVKRQGYQGYPYQGGYERMPHPAPYEAPQFLAPYEDSQHFNDQRWPLMWYLNRGGKLDMNVQGAWSEGITGKGVTVTILDDGIERTNPDLVANYDIEASFDVNQNDRDPTPRYDLTNSNRHGTRCAGEVAATANNSVCGVGVAFGAGIGGVRMLDGDVTDAVEARSLSLNSQHIDIYSASWGPDDDGKTVDGPGKLATRAFVEGITNGRRGHGSIFVWASGNGGRDHDNCNCDGYTNSVWTLSVSSATENGLIPWYSEACSSTMATTYSSGSSGERKIITTDLHQGCTSSHTGTSASAPLAAGIIALVLEANPNLGWRDVQHITVRNSHVANLRATDWRINGVGRNFSHSYGYGIMDTSAMVTMARNWTNAPEQKISMVKASIGPVSVPGKTKRSAKMEVKDAGDVAFLEHVQAHVTLIASRRGDVQLNLISPAGTRSQLLARRPHDSSRAGFNDWPFLTVFSWGENPIGTWELEVQNDGRYQVDLRAWAMTFHGTSTDPQPPPPTPAPVAPSPKVTPSKSVKKPAVPNMKPKPAVPSQDTSKSAILIKNPTSPQAIPLVNCASQSSPEWCVACVSGYHLMAGRCTQKCPEEAYFQGISNNTSSCLPCYYSCKTCSGPNDYQCSGCFADADLDSEGKNGQIFCRNKSLVARVLSTSRWYYILFLAFVLNLVIIIILVLYISKWRKQSSGASVMKQAYTGAATRYKSEFPVGLGGNTKSTIPFHDYESSDDERNLMAKPFKDDPE